MAQVEQLGGGRWYVQFVFAFMHLWFFVSLFFVSVHYFFIFSLISIHKMEWSTIPACPSLVCSFNRGSVDFERTNALKICLFV